PIETVNPPVIYTVKKMPPGLTISNTTGIINGKPTVPGSYLVSVQASNAAGKSNVLEFTIDVAGLEPELIGTFHGLIGRSGVMNGNVGSRLELVTTSKGTFTGKIITGTTSAAFKGALDSDPSDPDHPTINIPIKAASSIYLSLTLDATTNSLSGFHHIAMFVAAPVEGWRNVWSATNPASGYTNLHTFHLAQGDTDPALPQGYGFGSFKAAPKTGLISAAGKLADNSSFTTSTFIGPVGQVLLYQSLYTNKGSFFGKLTVTTGATADDTAITGAPSWFKPAPLPSSRDTIYRDGFGPFDLTAEGGTFIPPAKGNVIMGFDNVDNNAQLDFEQGSLTPAEEPDIVFSIRNTSPTATTNKAILPTFASGNNPFKVTMTTLNTGTGAFAGGFTIPGATVAKNRVATYSGMAVRVGGIYQGSGFFLAPKTPVGSETVATAPKSSGSVLLLKNP
ncbi:MAG TPA: Ig domain-containing protein, partial [Prosthecobacter sp.]|nr:Ig domain-containing protein [Prosthecobacter sp.]